MSEIVPIHDFGEGDEASCRVVKLNAPTGYSIAEAHRHNYYEILLFNTGGGTHMIDFDNYIIGAHGLHFISPGQIHALNRDAGVTAMWLFSQRNL